MNARPVTRLLSLLAATAAGAALTLAVTGGATPQAVHRPAATAARVAPVAHYAAIPAKAGAAKNTIYRYKIPTITSAPFTVTFPKLPKGPYLVTYSLTGGAADSTSRFICWVDTGTGSSQAAFTYSAEWNQFLTNNGSGVVDTSTKAAKLHCNAVGNVTTMPATTSPSAASVSFLRADALVKKTAKVTP
ncbi:MAG: hypothetical protein KDB63_22080 [Nocardioidaceae bacterium]|nr:hypothetical protein [Nocardioidaceae bacterium]